MNPDLTKTTQPAMPSVPKPAASAAPAQPASVKMTPDERRALWRSKIPEGGAKAPSNPANAGYEYGLTARRRMADDIRNGRYVDADHWRQNEEFIAKRAPSPSKPAQPPAPEAPTAPAESPVASARRGRWRKDVAPFGEEFKMRASGNGNVQLKSNTAEIEMRPATSEEIAARKDREDAANAESQAADAARQGELDRIHGKYGPASNYGATPNVSIDTGIRVGSREAAEHQAALDRSTRSDSGGMASIRRGFAARTAQAARDFGRTHVDPWKQAQIDHMRAQDHLELVRQANERRATDQKNDQYGKDREAAARQTRAAMRWYAGKAKFDAKTDAEAASAAQAADIEKSQKFHEMGLDANGNPIPRDPIEDAVAKQKAVDDYNDEREKKKQEERREDWSYLREYILRQYPDGNIPPEVYAGSGIADDDLVDFRLYVDKDIEPRKKRVVNNLARESARQGQLLNEMDYMKYGGSKELYGDYLKAFYAARPDLAPSSSREGNDDLSKWWYA